MTMAIKRIVDKWRGSEVAVLWINKRMGLVLLSVSLTSSCSISFRGANSEGSPSSERPSLRKDHMPVLKVRRAIVPCLG